MIFFLFAFISLQLINIANLQLQKKLCLIANLAHGYAMELDCKEDN